MIGHKRLLENSEQLDTARFEELRAIAMRARAVDVGAYTHDLQHVGVSATPE